MQTGTICRHAKAQRVFLQSNLSQETVWDETKRKEDRIYKIVNRLSGTGKKCQKHCLITDLQTSAGPSEGTGRGNWWIWGNEGKRGTDKGTKVQYAESGDDRDFRNCRRRVYAKYDAIWFTLEKCQWPSGRRTEFIPSNNSNKCKVEDIWITGMKHKFYKTRGKK